MKYFSKLSALFIASIFSLNVNAEAFPVEVWNTPFGSGNLPVSTKYDLLDRANKPHKICVSLPEAGGNWRYVTYGLVQQAKKTGVKLRIYSAGGYKNIDIQKSHIKKCSLNSDIIIVGSASYNLLTYYYRDISLYTPLVSVGNDTLQGGFFAKSVTSNELMGTELGRYLKYYYENKPKIKAIFLPGPKSNNWIEVYVIGLLNSLKKSNIEIIDTLYADLTVDAQRKALQNLSYKNAGKFDLIIANSIAGMEAVEYVYRNKLQEKVKIVTTATSRDVLKAIKDKKILASSFDYPMRQGQIALDQAIRILEGAKLLRFVSPHNSIINTENAHSDSLSEIEDAARTKTEFRVN